MFHLRITDLLAGGAGVRGPMRARAAAWTDIASASVWRVAATASSHAVTCSGSNPIQILIRDFEDLLYLLEGLEIRNICSVGLPPPRIKSRCLLFPHPTGGVRA